MGDDYGVKALEFQQLELSYLLKKLPQFLPHLKRIVEGQIFLDTHKRWCEGSCKTRNGLTWRSYNITCLESNSAHAVYDRLVSEFCRKSMKLFGYTIAVLFPELVKLLVMDHFQVAEVEAENIMFADVFIIKKKLQSSDSTDSDSDVPEIPSDLLKRASDIQKRLKRTDKGGCLLKGESSTVPVTFFSMKKKNKVYVKDGLAIEVMVDRDIGYDDLVEVGSKALEVPEIPDQSRMAALFTSGGALIQSVDNWSLSYYMKQHHRGPGKIRVGIGYIEVAKSSPKQPASSSSSELVPSEPEVDLTNSVDASGLDTVIVDFDSEENNGAGVDSRKRRCEARPVGSTKRPKIGNSSIVGPRKTRAGNTVEKPQSTLCMEFFAQELAEATKNYSRSTVLGRGGYGTVFRGFLRHSDVAVKVLTQDGKDAFTKEVSALGRFRHPNILQMFGFCTKPSALVFEFMSQGSLYDKLHVDKSSELDWRRRHSILQGCCKGIVYLHTASPPMIHQDVKSANILLDEMYRPKLGDFGFSLELPHITSGHTLFTAKFVARSEGYYPSELSSGKLSDRTDVYSFGVVVLETFCGLLAFDSKREDQKLVDYLQDDLSSESRFARLHDDKLEAPSNAMVSLMFHVVTMCLKRHSVRPKASEVLNMLEL